MGDCNISKYKRDLYSFDLFNSSKSLSMDLFPIYKHLNVPIETVGFYINYTSQFKYENQTYSLKIISAQFEESKCLKKNLAHRSTL